MPIKYCSTRNNTLKVEASQAVLKGLSDEGGLFVPEKMPTLDKTLAELATMDYQEVAYQVMKLFLTDYTKEELSACIKKAYDAKFDTPEIAPLVKVDDDYFLELFHGATIAFKDMALSILPHLLTTAAKKNKVEDEIVILTATSGDTGKAAMAGFADVAGTKIIVFYPKDGVSKVQEAQMLTQKGENVEVVAIKGNFDEAQSGVKALFENKGLEEELLHKGIRFSSANSINIGRLVPQVAYYVYAYTRLLKEAEIKDGEALNVVVPTGNFGNILAAYYAKEIGVPIHKLICGSNDNKVLYDFFKTGTYDKNRDFILTTSPSMDILISSNLERLLFAIADYDSKKTKELMEALKTGGKYSITADMQEKLKDFFAGYTTEEEVQSEIKKIYEETGYIIDTHTAVASYVCKTYKKETNDTRKNLVVSTASPYKFVKSVMTAIDKKYEAADEFSLLTKFENISKVKMPKAISEILEAKPIHKRVCNPNEMEATVREILDI